MTDTPYVPPHPENHVILPKILHHTPLPPQAINNGCLSLIDTLKFADVIVVAFLKRILRSILRCL